MVNGWFTVLTATDVAVWFFLQAHSDFDGSNARPKTRSMADWLGQDGTSGVRQSMRRLTSYALIREDEPPDILRGKPGTYTVLMPGPVREKLPSKRRPPAASHPDPLPLATRTPEASHPDPLPLAASPPAASAPTTYTPDPSTNPNTSSTRARRERKPASGPHPELIRHYATRWKAAYGAEPMIDGGTGTAMKKVLEKAQGNVARAKRIIDAYFADDYWADQKHPARLLNSADRLNAYDAPARPKGKFDDLLDSLNDLPPGIEL